eukprot:scaffold2714_cov123-Isochrysis_galbana.AAC.10
MSLGCRLGTPFCSLPLPPARGPLVVRRSSWGAPSSPRLSVSGAVPVLIISPHIRGPLAGVASPTFPPPMVRCAYSRF